MGVTALVPYNFHTLNPIKNNSQSPFFLSSKAAFLLQCCVPFDCPYSEIIFSCIILTTKKHNSRKLGK